MFWGTIDHQTSMTEWLDVGIKTCGWFTTNICNTEFLWLQVYPMFKIVDYPENKLLMNMYCMRQIISPTLCYRQSEPARTACTVMKILYLCVEWGTITPYLISYIIYKPCINFEWHGMYNVNNSCILNTPLPHS